MTNGVSDDGIKVENPYKVRLVDRHGARVVFDVSPDLSETRNVQYNNLEPVHMPGSIQVFKTSSSRTFQISGARMLSRTPKEAELTLQRLWYLRSWGVPRFGRGSTTLNQDERFARTERTNNPQRFQQFQADRNTRGPSGNSESREWRTGQEIVGAPPQILFLSAYSKNSAPEPQHINKVPTVLTNLTIPYPTDVDYINTTAGTPVPAVMMIDISLTETHAPSQYEQFSLHAFKHGYLSGF